MGLNVPVAALTAFASEVSPNDFSIPLDSSVDTVDSPPTIKRGVIQPRYAFMINIAFGSFDIQVNGTIHLE